MADVSHELDALRFVVDSPLSSKVAMFNKQTQQHQQQQLLNPFSSASGRASPKPTFSKDEYGKPLAGSLTEMRGQKANMHVMREMLELCQIIDSEGYNVKDEPKMRVIPFGELFNIYNYISDKVVGILLRARKHKLVEFEGEMLFQRRDDDVPIFLLRPIVEIREELNGKIEDIKRAGSPAPQATTLLLDKSGHKQKLASAASTPTASPAPSKPATPAQSKASSPVPSKASSPAPTDAVKIEQTATNTPIKTQPAAVVKHEMQPTPPELTITTAPDTPTTDVPESKGQFARLEGGEEAKTPTKKSANAADVSVTANETELNVMNHESAAPEPLEPVIAEHIEVVVPISADANPTNPANTESVVEIPTTTNIIDATSETPTVHAETLAAAPTLVEASTEAALKDASKQNNPEDPKA